mgnify:CR=1 FL=1
MPWEQHLNLQYWTSKNVAEWLTFNGFGHLAHCFVSHGVIGSSLLTIDLDKLLQEDADSKTRKEVAAARDQLKRFMKSTFSLHAHLLYFSC